MINEKNARDWALKWTNSSMTSTFDPQTVSIDLSGYTEVKMIFKFTNTTTNNVYIEMISDIGVGEYTAVNFGQFTATGAIYFYARWFTPTSTGVTFDKCARKQTTSSAVADTSNGFLIPYQIWAR